MGSPRDGTHVVFAFCFGLAVLLSMVSQRMATTPRETLVTLAAMGILLIPRSPWALGALCLAYGVQYTAGENRTSFVHTWLMFTIAVSILLALAATWHRDEAEWRRRFVEAYAPVGLSIATVCMFAAGFAKLNHSYLDPERSCGAVFYAWQRTVLPLPDAEWASILAIYGAMALELAAPSLWWHWRTRKLGFALGWVILFLLGTNPVGRLYEFTGPFLALMTLGLAWTVPPIAPRTRTVASVLFVGACVFAMTVGAEREWIEARFWLGRAVFVVWAVALLALGARSPSVRLTARLPVWRYAAWAVVLGLVLHEAMPYLGMRYARNFAMASGLRVNDYTSNHLIVRAPPNLGFNRTVKLIRSSDEKLDERGRVGWAWVAVSDHLARHPEVRATLEVDGTRFEKAPGADPKYRTSWLMPWFPVLQQTLTGNPRCGHALPGDQH